MGEPTSFPGRAPDDLLWHGVHEALHEPVGSERRRTAGAGVATSAAARHQALVAEVNEGDPAFAALLCPALQEAERVMVLVAKNLVHFRIPGLGDSKRTQLAAGCLHLVLEHGQSIVVLVQDKCFGSALALQRPLHETFWRGLWLRYAATDRQVDDAGRDRFPSKVEMLSDLNTAFGRQRSSYMQGWFWKQLCSYTHGGFQQIGARLTTDGLKSNYALLEVMQVLRSAGMVQLATAAEFATMAADESLALAVLEHLQSYGPTTQPAGR